MMIFQWFKALVLSILTFISGFANTSEKPKDIHKETQTSSLTYVGEFKGTYYAGRTVPCKGGSGRVLVDCKTGANEIKGSVASKYAYKKWGYGKNGRTKLYLVVEGYPSMSGWYAVDDCNAESSIIDFYFYANANCPWRKAGVVKVKCYI